MTRIFKYEPCTNPFGVRAGRVLLVAEQHQPGWPTLWVESEDDAPFVEYRIVGTGDEVPADHEHVGSAICGHFVWHVYRGQKQ